MTPVWIRSGWRVGDGRFHVGPYLRDGQLRLSAFWPAHPASEMPGHVLEIPTYVEAPHHGFLEYRPGRLTEEIKDGVDKTDAYDDHHGEHGYDLQEEQTGGTANETA
jgi:hypothetical protein